MLKRETEKIYELTHEGRVFVVERVCLEDEKADLLDALVALIKRDMEELSAHEK